MCSLCWLPVAENHNFLKILTLGGSCTGHLLPMRVKFGVLKQTVRLHLHAKFRLNVRLPVAKNHNFGQILTLGGSCTDPLLPMKAKSRVL